MTSPRLRVAIAPLSLATWSIHTIALTLGALPAFVEEPQLPPSSPVITDIEWAPKDTIIYMADDSDNWPLAWADDGHLYTAYGDGWGFEPYIDPDMSRQTKLSLGFARVEGHPPDLTAVNIRSETGERRGDGRRGKKASGLIQVDGVFYMFVRNADGAGNAVTLAWSDDYLKTWTWADWKIPELGYCAFIDFGKNYAGARDDYIYFHSPDTPSAYEETDQVVMGRVPRDRIHDRGAYTFFAGFDEAEQPTWSSDIGDREPVLTIPGCANRLDVAYNPALDRYLMTMRSRGRAGGRNQFSIYDAPEPWGPWTTVYYTETWGEQRLQDMHFQAAWGEAQRIPPKWISEDGTSFYLVFAGGDHFAVRQARLTVNPGPSGPQQAAADAEVPLDCQPYLAASERFAQCVLEHGRDVYGKEHSPLFVDGLHVETLEPVRWAHEDGKWVVSNFASHQTLLRLLDGLTAVTGEATYREAAERSTAYALDHLAGRSGLLYWGRHSTYDLETNAPVYGSTHELKSAQPYYDLMWRVNAEATGDLLAAIWGGHVVDWSRLDFNRHANIERSAASPPWDHAFDEDLEVPFETGQGGVLSFANFGLSLMHAGAMLALFDEHEGARLWTHRLALRWQQGKHPETGLGGGQISHLALDRDRARLGLGHVHPDINEANMVAAYLRAIRYEHLALAQLQMGERLLSGDAGSAELGRRLIEWASADLQAYAEHAWDPNEQHFRSVLTDGTPLQWQEVRSGYFGVRREALGPADANGQILWAFALAHRLSEDPVHWKTAGQLMGAMDLGDLGSAGGEGRSLNFDTDHLDWMTLYALLELHDAVGDHAILRLAARIGDNIRDAQSDTGLFPREGHQWARTGDEMPFALLHLAAAIDGRRDELPAAVINFNGFHAVYHGNPGRHSGDRRTYDYLLFFGHSMPGRYEW